MLYIVTALKSEAQAFVEYYKLSKSKLNNFIIYSNNSITLIVSHMGVVNTTKATQTLINNFDITDEDIYLNIGICGANSSYEIGSLVEIGAIVYDGITYSFQEKKHSITCVNEAIDENKYEIVDMESFGFYDAIIHNPAIKTFHILKVVSDHFEPEKVTKDWTKNLILKHLSSSSILNEL